MRRPLRLVLLAGVAGGALLAVASAGSADEIQLRRGGRITGVVTERTDKTVTIATGPGQVTLPLTVVEKIVEGRSALAAFQERASALSTADVAGWAALARWADGQALDTQAREAWRRVLTLDPQNAEANAALGRVRVDGTWVSPEDAYRAQGLVPFEGRWVSQAEQQSLLQQRAAESAAELQRREGEIRLREAEARARQAEANARARETEADMPGDGGIPLWGVPGYGGYGYGGYAAGGYGYGDSGHGHGDRGHGDHAGGASRPRPQPAPTPVPSSIGPLPSKPPAQAPPAGTRPPATDGRRDDARPRSSLH